MEPEQAAVFASGRSSISDKRPPTCYHDPDENTARRSHREQED